MNSGQNSSAAPRASSRMDRVPLFFVNEWECIRAEAVDEGEAIELFKLRMQDLAMTPRVSYGESESGAAYASTCWEKYVKNPHYYEMDWKAIRSQSIDDHEAIRLYRLHLKHWRVPYRAPPDDLRATEADVPMVDIAANTSSTSTTGVATVTSTSSASLAVDEEARSTVAVSPQVNSENASAPPRVSWAIDYMQNPHLYVEDWKELCRLYDNDYDEAHEAYKEHLAMHGVPYRAPSMPSSSARPQAQ